MPRNWLADRLRGYGLNTLADRANSPTSGLGVVADGVGGVVNMLLQPVASFQEMLANPYQRGQDDARFVENAFDVAGGAMTGGLLAPRPRGSVGMGGRPTDQPTGIRAYHGSPHDFDRFDMSKIGTGEGAQAYGHGLYFAEKESVAKGYRDRLSDGPTFADGTVVPERAASLLADYKSIDGAIDAVRRRHDNVINQLSEYKALPPTWKNAWGESRDDIIASLEAQITSHKTNSASAIAELEALRGKTIAQPGRMYEVRINADPEDFIDWDKPLSQQSEKVRRAVDERYIDAGSERPLGERLGRVTRDDGVRNDLLRQGIPGIRYLDQGSRGAGEGSRNYVVFDDNLVEILRKYGLAGLLGAGGAVNSLLSNYGYDAPGQPQAQPDWTRNLRPGDI